jgi:hypothetical protein
MAFVVMSGIEIGAGSKEARPSGNSANGPLETAPKGSQPKLTPPPTQTAAPPRMLGWVVASMSVFVGFVIRPRAADSCCACNNELAYARRFGKKGDANRGPFPGDVGLRLGDDTDNVPLTLELEHDCKLYLTPLQRSERTEGPMQAFKATSNNLAQSALPIRAAQDRRKWRRHRQSDSLSSSSAGLDWDPAI